MPIAIRSLPRFLRRASIAHGLGVLLVLALILSIWLWRAHETILEAALAGARTTARGTAADIDRQLKSADEINRYILSWSPRLLADHGNDQLRALKDSAPHFMDLLLLDGDGVTRYWSGDGQPPDARDRPFHRTHAEQPGRNLYLDEPRLSRVHIGHWYFSLSRAIRTADGGIDRIAVSILEAAAFDTRIKAAAADAGIAAMLFHHGGKLIADSRLKEPFGRPAPPAYLATVGSQGIRGEQTLAWIEPVGNFPLSVVVEVDRHAALEPWWERARLGSAVFLVVGAVIVLLALRQARHDQSLAEAESRYRALTEQSLVGIALTRDGALLYANPRLDEIFGLPAASLAGRGSLHDCIAAADRERVEQQFLNWQHDAGATTAITLHGRHENGGNIELEAHGRQVIIDGQAAALVVLSDVTEQATSRRELHRMAYHDPLTGLPNRALLFDRLSQTLARTQRSGGRFALMLVDLDGFKEVNDRLGHDAGDAVLRTVAQRLGKGLRESDTVARMGGDEFLVILATTQGNADAEGVAQKLLVELARPIALGDAIDAAVPPDQRAISGSIGIAFYPDHGDSMDALISAADAAMYAAKKAGRNTFAFAPTPADIRLARDGAFLSWSDEQPLGVAAIDDEHQKLFALCNELAMRYASGADRGRRLDALTALRDYATLHFRSEEQLMAQSGYPDAEGHLRQHRDLENKLAALEGLLFEHGPAMALRTLKDWLLAHHRTADRGFVDFLQRRREAGPRL